MRKQHLAALALCVALVPGLFACSSSSEGDTGGNATTAETTGTTSRAATASTITVFAAASLKTTFEALGAQFASEHDGVTVEFNFAGSSDLVAQIQQGAAADVFASADTANMDKLVSDDLLASEPESFATNTLTIAVPPGNPAGITLLADLTKEDVNLVVCAPEVPCGRAAGKVEEASGLDFMPVSEEQSVTDVLNKVIAGEADAGLVYVTDVINAGAKVEGIDFPEASSAVNTYPIATIADSDAPDLAQEFVELVLGATGQSVLRDAGFAKP